MKDETKAILCSPELIQTRDAHFVRLKALFAGETPEHVFALCGYVGTGQSDPYLDPERWVEEALDDLAANADQLRDASVFRPLVLEFDPYGVHFVDRMFGAEVFELHDKWNWQAKCLETPIGDLRPPDLEADETWQLAWRLATTFVRVGVTVPLFGLPVIASALNIALNLYGQSILLAMVTRPEAARRDLEAINGVLCEMHRRCRSLLPVDQLQPVIAAYRTQPPGFGQICGCSTQLLSEGMYRDFIAPLDDAVLSVYPHGGMIHLCGAHTQHIPVWREMKSLRAIQLNDRAADDLPIYFRELREDQVFYVNPCDGMPVERIMAITGGRRTVIVADLTEPLLTS